MKKNILCGKVALVTGAGRGIGKACAIKFAEEGATVYAGLRNMDLGNELILNCERLAGCIIPIYLDVCDTESIKDAALKIKKDCGVLDVLINNAGITSINRLEMVSDEVISSIYDTNVFGVIKTTRSFIRLLKKSDSASIVNISSILFEQGDIGQTVYAGSKAAVSTMTKVWAKEYVSNGIRVNAVAPGSVDTDMFNIADGKVRDDSINKIGFGRIANLDEIANVVLFLATDMSSYVTGEVVRVSGGWFI